MVLNKNVALEHLRIGVNSAPHTDEVVSGKNRSLRHMSGEVDLSLLWALVVSMGNHALLF